MSKFLFLLLAATMHFGAWAGVGACSMFACPNLVSSGADSVRTNKVYAGLKWTWEQTNAQKPDLVVGVRTSKIDSEGKMHGGDLSLTFKEFTNPIFSKLRLKYFNGKEVNQSELSLGYDKQKGQFAGFSLKAPHANAGMDFFEASFDEKARETYFIVDTLKRSFKPNATTSYVCPTGTTPMTTPVTATTGCM